MYNTFYRGIVIDNEDPQSLGKIKVRVPAIHGQPGYTESFIADDFLPWATPAIYRGIDGNSGEYIPYPIGSLVFISFEGEDQNNPIVFGTVPYLENDISNISGWNKGIYLYKLGDQKYIFIDEKGDNISIRNINTGINLSYDKVSLTNGAYRLEIRTDGIYKIENGVETKL